MSEFKPMTTNLGTHSSVGDSATSVTILAANTRRRGASIVNASTAILYLNMTGDTATATTAHHVQLPTLAYYEVPFGFTGLITGIWASDAGGSANVVEYT
jgi:hypothetical protein